MRCKNIFIFIFLIPTAWAELDISSEAFQKDFNKILSFQACRLRGNESNKDINFIENLKLQTSMDKSMIEDVVSSITLRSSSNDLNCYLRINLTVLLAQSLDRLGYYFEAVDLYNKILTYNGLDNDFKKNINRLASQAKSKQIAKQQKFKKPIPDIKINLSKQDKSDEIQERANKETIDKLAKKIIKLQSNIDNLKTDAASKNKEIILLKESLNKVLDNFSEQEYYIKELERDLIDYELSDPKTNKDKVFQKISDQLIFFEDQNSSLASSNKDMQKSIDNLKMQILDLRKQIDDLDSELSKVGDSNNLSQSNSNELTPFYVVIALLVGALFSIFYKNDGTLKNGKDSSRNKYYIDSKKIKEISDFKELEIALDSILLQKNFEFNENGNFLFGYINGIVESFTNNSIAASLEKDKLIERYFKRPLIDVEKYFRFNSNIKIYEMALLSGKKDAQVFTDENKLNELEDYLNKNHH